MASAETNSVATLPPPPGSVTGASLAMAGLAAAAMVATLPGRTHGLALITEPLMRDLGVERIPFATINTWATLLGALFCLPIGWMIDRLSLRIVLSLVLLSLGATVLMMARLASGGTEMPLPALDEVVTSGVLDWTSVPAELFVLILLTRGLGQSALSVVSLALMGKSATDRPGLIVGIYSFLLSIGFMIAFGVMMSAFKSGADWRTVWSGVGWTLIAFGVVAGLFLRVRYQSSSDEPVVAHAVGSRTLAGALISPAFWVFGLSTSFFGMVAAGMSLFNQSLLAERGFDRDLFMKVTMIAPLVGLIANLLAGWLTQYLRLGILLALGLVIQSAALALFPSVSTVSEVYAYAIALGISGGILTVIFFAVWRQAYGTKNLGQIQGAAQLMTVVASAAGPLVLAKGHQSYGSYSPVVQSLAWVGIAFAVAAWIVPLPQAHTLQKEPV